MEAISHAGTSLGILAKEGIILAAEKKVTSKLLDPRQAQEKIFTISEYHWQRHLTSIGTFCAWWRGSRRTPTSSSTTPV